MSEVVRAYYDGKVEYEWERLAMPMRHLEFASTLRLLDAYFPPAGRVLDVGSGPGRYSIELLERGYSVTLYELSPKQLARARQEIAKAGLVAEEYINDDARNLGRMPAEAFDALLLMGPMYHLIDGSDRQRVLAECHRILKPGGILLAAYINSWGLLRAGLTEFADEFQDPSALRDLLGESIQAGGDVGGFTEAYFTTPPAALEEVSGAGFEVISRAGVESFAAGQKHTMHDLRETKPVVYENIKRMVAETCELEPFRDTTEHLHIVARKPLGR